MENLSNRLADIENRIEEKIAEQDQPKMTQEQANAVMNIAKDPKEFIGVKVSQKINYLIEHNDEFGEKFTNLAKSTVHSQIDTFDTTNKLQNKKNYYQLNEKDVLSLGGDKSSTKGQQFSIVMIKRFFWIFFMATLGTFFIAPMTVVIELFQGISFKNIEKIEYETKNNSEKKTEWVIKKHKLGKVGTIVGWVVGLGVWGLEIFLIYKFTKIFSILAVAVFFALIIINIGFSINTNLLRKIFKKSRGEEVNENISQSIEVETDEG